MDYPDLGLVALQKTEKERRELGMPGPNNVPMLKDIS